MFSYSVNNVCFIYLDNALPLRDREGGGFDYGTARMQHQLEQTL